jgi:hypothetical protein
MGLLVRAIHGASFVCAEILQKKILLSSIETRGHEKHFRYLVI